MMRLPNSTDLSNFNYVLSVILNLSGSPEGCSVKAVNDTCKQKTFNAQLIDYRPILEILELCGLVQRKDVMVSVSMGGLNFLKLNPRSFSELTGDQKEHLAINVVFNGSYKRDASKLFTSFIPDYDEMTYKFEISDFFDISISYKKAFHLFEYLGILRKGNRHYYVNSNYVNLVRIVRSEKKGISQEELEFKLDENRKLGTKAEEIIVEFERIRLRTLGLYAEADRVKRISEMEPSAGYDINSYSGNGPMGEYDKFIEVKASQKPFTEFYWSKNEIATAKLQRSNYWIYFLSNFSQSTGVSEINPLTISKSF